MLKSFSKNLPAPLQTLSAERLLIPGVVALIAVFLVIGTATQSTPDQAAFGLATQSFLVLAFLSFIGGVVSFVSPCTLPILPAYFAFATQSGRKRIALNTIAFMLGVATMFSLLGASASALGRILLQNQQLLLLFGGAIVMGFGVMSLLGKGFTGVSQTTGASAPSTTARGSYVFGLTFSVGWSSCVGPILGVVLTLAASTGSVFRGMILLFIYALGLGLPLIIVSTFFGRASRKSLFWRALKGKGWQWNTHTIVVGLLWALAIWRILAAIGTYLFRNLDFFAGQQFSAGHELGLLILAVAGVALWVFTSPGDRRTTLELHSTQTFSGVLFILMAVLMLNGTLASFNSLIPADLAVWFAGLEERLIEFFS
jgi:cytochrome c-type biogenesis protein